MDGGDLSFADVSVKEWCVYFLLTLHTYSQFIKTNPFAIYQKIIHVLTIFL